MKKLQLATAIMEQRKFLEKILMRKSLVSSLKTTKAYLRIKAASSIFTSLSVITATQATLMKSVQVLVFKCCFRNEG